MCHVDEYLNDDLPVCMQTESNSWESDFLQHLGESQEEEQVSDKEGSNELDTDPAPKLTNFKEAIQSQRLNRRSSLDWFVSGQTTTLAI